MLDKDDVDGNLDVNPFVSPVEFLGSQRGYSGDKICQRNKRVYGTLFSIITTAEVIRILKHLVPFFVAFLQYPKHSGKRYGGARQGHCESQDQCLEASFLFLPSRLYYPESTSIISSIEIRAKTLCSTFLLSVV